MGKVDKTIKWYRTVLNYTNVAKLILRKIIKIAEAICHIIFEAKRHQIRYRLGLSPRPLWGDESATPDL